MSLPTRTFPLSKRKLTLALFGCLAFVALGIWLWGRRDQYTGFAQWKLYFCAWSGMVFFGLGIAVLAFKLFDTRPGLVLNTQGIHSLGLFGFRPVIPWQHITGTRIVQLPRGRVRILLIHTDDMEAALARMSGMARLFARFSLARYGALHSVASNNLQVDIEELQRIIESWREAAHADR